MTRISIPTSLAILTLLVACGTSESGTGGEGGAGGVDFTAFEWTELNGNAPWAARAGLHTVELDGKFYLMGGRTPLDSPIPGASTLWSDVWISEDEGASWTQVLESGADGHWAPRAYLSSLRMQAGLPVPACAPSSSKTRSTSLVAHSSTTTRSSARAALRESTSTTSGSRPMESTGSK
jgi:hypothetical protein